jgi:hypothetical protein
MTVSAAGLSLGKSGGSLRAQKRRACGLDEHLAAADRDSRECGHSSHGLRDYLCGRVLLQHLNNP